MYEKYRGSKEEYDQVFILCCALVNYEVVICRHGFKESDKHFYDCYKVNMLMDKEKIAKAVKRKRKQQAEARKAKFEKGTPSSETDSD